MVKRLATIRRGRVRYPLTAEITLTRSAISFVLYAARVVVAMSAPRSDVPKPNGVNVSNERQT